MSNPSTLIMSKDKELDEEFFDDLDESLNDYYDGGDDRYCEPEDYQFKDYKEPSFPEDCANMTKFMRKNEICFDVWELPCGENTGPGEGSHTRIFTCKCNMFKEPCRFIKSCVCMGFA